MVIFGVVTERVFLDTLSPGFMRNSEVWRWLRRARGMLNYRENIHIFCHVWIVGVIMVRREAAELPADLLPRSSDKQNF
mgnify:FL=1